MAKTLPAPDGPPKPCKECNRHGATYGGKCAVCYLDIKEEEAEKV